MFMVIAPGTYKLTVKFYVKDTHTNVSGVITKKFGSFNYGANDYYDIASALDIKYYGDDYYMSDSREEYWYQYKGDQPKEADVPGSNYPTESDALRWYNNKAKFPTAASNSAKSCPNVNELYWYCLKGDPHWDNITLWAVWGHLYTGGMWFKKASVIASENGKVDAAALKNINPYGKDYAHTDHFVTPPNNKSIKSAMPEERKKYFFLPAMGRYEADKLVEFRTTGRYWSSTPDPVNQKKSYSLYFKSDDVVVSNANERMNGFRLWTSE